MLEDHYRAAFKHDVQSMLEKEALELERHARSEALTRCEVALGLPMIRIDATRGVVTLSPEIAGSEGTSTAASSPSLRRNLPQAPPSELLEVKVAHDAQGRLVRADPHPRLGLWSEAKAAVDSDNLGRLLALVWSRAFEEHRSVAGA
eukprot:TRINITY_DN4567_c0_g1_i3.p2 TRINITY_DN4567_c0_g1~~TRINITY_DN4567_c0_g1_i3.p2  ORF type:complete len:147 (-),score=27.17 TRINITY_DN4567_c0_g1_i3:256-696(-)